MTNPLDKIIRGVVKSARPASGRVPDLVSKISDLAKTQVVPMPNRWFLEPNKFPYVQPLVEKVLKENNMQRGDFFSGAFVDPKTGKILDFNVMQDVGVVIDPATNRPKMSGLASGIGSFMDIPQSMGPQTKSNLVRKGLFKTAGGDPLLNDINFLATVERSGAGHQYGLGTEYATPTEMLNTMSGDNPTLRPHSRGDLFGVGDVVGKIVTPRGQPTDVYESLLIAPSGSDVEGVRLHKKKGGAVSQDAMNLSVMNQKVQRKMGGGPGNEEMLSILSREKDGGLVHGKKNGGEAKKPFSNDFERRQQMAGSVMPSQREMEEALRPATVNSLLKRAADRRQGKAMQEEPESPEVIPEGEVRPYDPTFKQDKSAKIQRGLESLGFPKPRARSIAQNIMGEGGIGIADFVPFVGTGMSLQETKRSVERARDKGDQTGVVTELGLGALNAAAGLWGTKALAKTLASSIKKSPYQRYSQAEFDRILREGAAQESQRLLPTGQRLLNGPTEQLLLNAPKREKTVFEMQQELAQKHAMLPKSQYGLELPPGNTAAQRADVMFPVNAYHGTADDIAAFDLSQSGRHLTKDWGNAVSLSPSSSNAEYYAVNAGSAPEKNAAFARYEANPTNEALIEFRKAARLAEVNPTGANIMPLRLDASRSEDYLVQSGRNDPFLYQNSRMKENKKDVAKILDNPNVISEYAVYNPDKIRSRFAAFDPFRRNAAVAAATGMAAPDLLAEEYANGGEVTSDDLILIERRS